MTTHERNRPTVIHLEFNGEHYYFGSIACIYENFTPKDLGISYGSLRNYGLSPGKPYKNNKCIIRKGTLLSKSVKRDSNNH